MLRKAVFLIMTILVTGHAQADESLLKLATTTSTANTGLMELLLPKFTEETSIEVHLIDYDGDLYGQTLDLYFVDRIRCEQTFSGAEALLEHAAMKYGAGP